MSKYASPCIASLARCLAANRLGESTSQMVEKIDQWMQDVDGRRLTFMNLTISQGSLCFLRSAEVFACFCEAAAERVALEVKTFEMVSTLAIKAGN